MAESEGPTVFVGWLHPLDVKARFAESLLGLLAYDAIVRTSEGKPRQIAAMNGFEAGVNIATPRNDLVRRFLDHPEWGEWCLMVDVDMQFDPDAVERLLAVADPVKAPIVGGLCFGATDNDLWPTVYELAEEPGQGPFFMRAGEIPAEGLMRCAGTGAAFLLVHRSVFEKVVERRWPEDPHGHFPWFQESQFPIGPVGEDLTFCLRAGICGFPVHVLTSLHIGHIKPTVLNAYRYFKQQGRVVDGPPEDDPGVAAVAPYWPLPPDLTGAAEPAGVGA